MKYQYLGIVLAICAASHALGETLSTTILESATMGPQFQIGGYSIATIQYLGARFHINQPTLVDQVGGVMAGFGPLETTTIFAAISEITSPTGFPAKRPSEFQPLALTNFDLTTGEIQDWRVPLSVQLSPGDYALIFGTGRFGVTGHAQMYDQNHDTLQASYFQGSYDLPDGRNDLWLNSVALHNLRFVVTGTVIPEPNTATLFVFVALVLGLARGRTTRDEF